MMLTKARKRQLALSLMGIALAWALSVAIGVVLFPDWLALIVPATTVIAVLVTYVTSRRIRAHSRRASITVGDLRGTRATQRRPARR